MSTLAATGCGATSETMKQLRTHATTACLIATSRAARIPLPTRLDAGAAFLENGITAIAPELRQLRTLRPPVSAKSTYQTALTAFTQKLQALRSARKAIRQGTDPGATIRILQAKLAPLESQEDAAWQKLGIPACLNR